MANKPLSALIPLFLRNRGHFSAFFPGGCIPEGEEFRLMTGLGILKHDAIRIEGIAGNHRQTVIAIEIQMPSVIFRGPFHGDLPLTGNDLHAQIMLQIRIDGLLGDLRSQISHHRLQEEIHVQDQSLSVKITDTLHPEQLCSHRKAGPVCQSFIRQNRLEPDNPGFIGEVVSLGTFPEGFDTADGKILLY